MEVHYHLPRVSPFDRDLEEGRGCWNGSFMGDPDLPNKLHAEDIFLVLWSYETNPDDWDGTCAAVVQMNDHRLVTWETFWGPTGDGFYEDAYGGDTDVHICKNVRESLLFGLSGSNRTNACKAMGVEESSLEN